MDKKDQGGNVSLREIRELDLVEFLANLGHQPSRIRNNDFWYLSPLRKETQASFKVNRRINRWYDHGLGKGGNLIDFAILYHGCSIGEFLSGIRGENPLPRHSHEAFPISQQRSEEKIEIVRDMSLRSGSLLRYLQDRRISVKVADLYCRELRYRVGHRSYYGIGFANDGGGFEIRNPLFKASSSPKDISTFHQGNPVVSVFEGFMDFLTFRTLHRDLDESRMDFVVLNSVSMFDRSLQVLQGHQQVSLYLDRDSAGRDLTARALSLGEKFRDESELYSNHKDLNDWSVNIGLAATPATSRKLTR
ncbi:toprim domain-containing protein [Sphingobacterium daejeonense]|uniref:Toprim domain-containing protein n=1 Tax=Sphingobacterium daejeonense TaxID=371142 RepID=A0ABW3RPM0_9SPHI